MNPEFSYARAIWWADRYLGTLEPDGETRALLKNNMDVDYYFTRELTAFLPPKARYMSEDDVTIWWGHVLACDLFKQAESLESSRDLRDVWFCMPPSWLPEDWRDELSMVPRN